MIWLALLGCGGLGPEEPRDLQARVALDGYLAGRKVLEEAPRDAAAVFEGAASVGVGAGLLHVWEAHALARSGDLDGAMAVLKEVTKRDPNLGEAWYNLACYRARSGDLEGAGRALDRALLLSVRTPRQASADPDLRALAAAGGHELLPADPIEWQWVYPEGSRLLGDSWEVRLKVRTPEADPLTLQATLRGPFDLVSVEETVTVTPREVVHDFVWRADVAGTGGVRLRASLGDLQTSYEANLDVLGGSPRDRTYELMVPRVADDVVRTPAPPGSIRVHVVAPDDTWSGWLPSTATSN